MFFVKRCRKENVAMAIGDTYRMRVVWRKTASGTAAINDFYFRQEAALILDTIGKDMWDAFIFSCESTYEALISSVLSTIEVQFGKEPTFETEEVVVTPYLQGAVTGDAMPGQICGVLSRRTATLSRRGRGRLYIPSTGESMNAGGLPSSTYTNALQAFGDSMLPEIGDGITSGPYTPMLWSVADQEAREITSFQARSLWGIQRDRFRLMVG